MFHGCILCFAGAVKACERGHRCPSTLELNGPDAVVGRLLQQIGSSCSD